MATLTGGAPGETLAKRSCIGLLRHWDSLLEARVIIEDWRIDYNLNRPHTAHGDLTPTEFATNWTTINQPQAA